MKAFKDLKFEKDKVLQGVYAKMNFPNNYGVSVIRNRYSYGGAQGLYELAVLYKGEITYNTPITNNVLGHLNEQEVSEVMNKVQKN